MEVHSTAHEMVQRALAALRQGNKAQARKLLRQATLADPDYSAAWLALAACSEPKASLAYIERALVLDPDNPQAIKAQEWANKRLQASVVATSGRTQPLPAVNSLTETQPRPAANAAAADVIATLNDVAADAAADATPTPTPPYPAPSKSGPPNPSLPHLALLAVGFVLAAVLGIGTLFVVGTAMAGQSLPTPVAMVVEGHTATFTATFTPTNTPTSTNTPTPTATPTDTPTPTPTFTHTPTNTSTPTATFTNTPVPPTPTFTPIPPSATSPPAAPASSGLPAQPNAPAGERWIDVNLSTQTVRAMVGDQVMATFIVSTGKAATPTVTGRYRIYVKYRYANMSGPGYFLRDVPYVMYFYLGYGFHGTYWHSNFGTPMSRGCVNLNNADAEWLYNFADIGTLVDIHY